MFMNRQPITGWYREHGLEPPVAPSRVLALRPTQVRRSVVCILAMLAVAPIIAAYAEHIPSHQRAGSYDVDIGVVPAAQARVTESRMGSAPHREAVRRGEYHVVVSLRDISSRQVVADAVVRAQVGPLGMSAQTKSLDSMTINDAASYGNYFAIPGRGPFTVHLWIEHPGASAARTEAVFSLRRN